MKITITLKDPDGVYDSVTEHLLDQTCSKCGQTLHEEYTREEMIHKLKKWIEFEEYVRIEFDLDKMTAKVLENEVEEFEL